MTLKGQGRDLNVLRPNISKTAGDRDLGPMDHQSEMTYWDSNGHVTNDVTLTRKVKVMTPIYLGAYYLDNGWRYGLGANGASIGNDYL